MSGAEVQSVPILHAKTGCSYSGARLQVTVRSLIGISIDVKLGRLPEHKCIAQLWMGGSDQDMPLHSDIQSRNPGGKREVA